MSSSPNAIDNYTNEDVIIMMAAAMQAEGVEGSLLGLPVLLWGAPGVGKTSRINKVANRLGFYNKDLTVLASVREPQDFIGIPLPGGKPVDIGGQPVSALRFAPPIWAVIAAKNAADTGNPLDPKAVVFFDEFTTADDRVMAAMLRVIHERVVGEFELPKNVVMVAAANPPSMSPAGTDLKPPVANRFIHLYWVPPTPKQWADWLTQDLPSATQTIDTKLKEDADYLTIDRDKFYKELGNLKQNFADWVQTEQGQGYLFKMPGPEADDIKSYFEEHPNGEPLRHPPIPPGIAPMDVVTSLTYDAQFTDIYAWPSPRSLEIACRARAAVRALRGVPLMRQIPLENSIVCGTIGTQACLALNSFIEQEALQLVPPGDFVESRATREQFFSANPTDSTQSIQLSRVVKWWRDLPTATAQTLDDDLEPAIMSFSGDRISANFSPLRPGMLEHAFEPMTSWVNSKAGQESMSADPAKADQLNKLSAATKKLMQTLKAMK